VIKKIEDVEKVLEAVIHSSETNSHLGHIETSSLGILGTTFNCSWGTYWRVDGYRLVPSTIWRASGVDAAKLYADTTQRSLSLSEGTAGHAWRSRKPVWSIDLGADMCLPRSLDAEEIGLHGGIWFAVQTDSRIYGIVELLGRNLPLASKELLLVVERLGYKIGFIIERRTPDPLEEKKSGTG
jgi:hypothetical protein